MTNARTYANWQTRRTTTNTTAPLKLRPYGAIQICLLLLLLLLVIMVNDVVSYVTLSAQ